MYNSGCELCALTSRFDLFTRTMTLANHIRANLSAWPPFWAISNGKKSRPFDPTDAQIFNLWCKNIEGPKKFKSPRFENAFWYWSLGNWWMRVLTETTAVQDSQLSYVSSSKIRRWNKTYLYWNYKKKQDTFSENKLGLFKRYIKACVVDLTKPHTNQKRMYSGNGLP